MSTKELQEAIKRRDEYLENNPHLKEFQKEIDSVLEKTVTPQDRVDAINLMLGGKLNELKDALCKLRDSLEGVSDK